MFSDLASFSPPPHITLHDFDAFSHLQLLKKLGKLPDDIKIIGIPPTISKQEALREVGAIIAEASQPSKSGRHNSYTDRTRE